jgi:hypothetical protein
VEVPWLPKPGFVGEVSAFAKLGSKYYLICDSHVGDGWFSKVFVSDTPQGPYRPTRRNYLITHSPDLYDKFHHSADGELLTEGIVWSVPEDNSRWYYHVPPFKKVESDGENLWFKWWQGNEKLRIHPVELPGVEASKERPGAITMLAEPFEVEKGMLIEGNISLKGVQSPGDEKNLAAGAKVTTSGDFDVRISGEGIDGTPAAALDGNRETVWVPKPQGSDPHWYELDMGALQQVGRVLVRWTNRSHPAWWRIELSSDRVNWKTIGEEAPPKPPEWNIYHASLARTFITGLSERARYMRITIQPNPAGRRTDGGSVEGIVEIGVYGKPYETAGIGAGCPPGLFFECEGGGGEAVVFEPGRLAHYGWLNADGTDFHRELTLEIGTAPEEEAGFRVIWRDELAEIYLDDYYLLMINLRKEATGRMGFINSGGKNLVSGVKAWYADPEYQH